MKTIFQKSFYVETNRTLILSIGNRVTGTLLWNQVVISFQKKKLGRHLKPIIHSYD
jgi:hypothetical protein